MKLRNIAIAFLGSILFATCGKDDGGDKLYTPEESKAIVKSTMDNFYNCLKKANDGGFANFFYDGLFKGFDRNNPDGEETWFNILGEKFDNQHYADALRDGVNKFKFEALKGTYVWSKNKELWEKTANSANITLKFPATKEATTNNGLLIIDQYEDTSVSYEGEESFLPTKAHGVITVDGTKVFEVTLNKASYKKGTNFTMPKEVNLSIFTNPFTTTIKFREQGAGNFAFDFAFASAEGCTTALHADVKLNTADYENLTGMEVIDHISFVVTQGELQIKGVVDAKSINKITKDQNHELTPDEINTFVKADLYRGNGKIADVKYEKENGKGVIYFIYSDGSREKAEQYVSDFGKRVTEIFKRFDK